MRRLDRDGVTIALLAGGFATKAIEVRDLHRAARVDHRYAWIPIAFGALTRLAHLFAMGASIVLLNRHGSDA